MTSSSPSSSTARIAATLPVRAVSRMLRTPEPPRRCRRYSLRRVRLPSPSSVATSRYLPSLLIAIPTSASSRRRVMPMTPRAARPISRTLASLNRIACPFRVARSTSSFPSVRRTATSSSSLSRVIAAMPARLALMNSIRPVFFTLPCLVAKKRYPVSSKDRMGMMALTRSPWAMLKRLTRLVPLAVRPASGTS